MANGMTQTYGMGSPIIRPLGRMTQNIMATPIGGTMTTPQVSTVMPNPMTTPQVSTVMPTVSTPQVSTVMPTVSTPQVPVQNNRSIFAVFTMDPNVIYQNSNPSNVILYSNKSNSNVGLDLVNENFKQTKDLNIFLQIQNSNVNTTPRATAVNKFSTAIGMAQSEIKNDEIIPEQNLTQMNVLNTFQKNVDNQQTLDGVLNQYFTSNTTKVSQVTPPTVANIQVRSMNSFYNSANRNSTQIPTVAFTQMNALTNAFYSSR